MFVHGSAVPVRIGVLGCADIAARRVLPALRTVPGAEVAAVASRSAAKARALAGQYGADAVVGYQNLLARQDITAVYVPLPSALHAHWVRQALLAGKHVLAEKPLTTSLADTVELTALAEERGLVLLENYMFLHHGQHSRVRDLVAAGAIGTPRHFTAAFAIPARPPGDIRLDPELGGGALLDTGGYPVAAAVELLGDELAVLAATTREEAGVDVAGSALLRTPSGLSVALSYGLDHAYGSRYEFWGSAGRLVLEHVFTPPATHEPVVRIERSTGTAEEIRLPAECQVQAALTAFVQAAAGATTPPGTRRAILTRARLTAEIAEAGRGSLARAQ